MSSDPSIASPSVGEFLDRPLGRAARLQELTNAIADVTARPLDVTIDDLRTVIKSRRIGIEDQRRLHVLISGLYHRNGASQALVHELRVEVLDAFNASRTAGNREE
jgi:monomeric isocitrate dehydrogenase